MIKFTDIGNIDPSEFYLMLIDRRIEYVNLRTKLVYVQEGSGDQLLPEDMDEGYVDYIDYEVYNYKNDTVLSEYDGGLVLLRKPYRRFSEEEIIKMILEELEMDPEKTHIIRLAEMPEERTFRVYGRPGHRQKESFNPSRIEDYSNPSQGIRIMNIKNSDRTGTNAYTELRITGNDSKECLYELKGQVTDGLFENCGTGLVTEVLEDGSTQEVEI